MTNNEKKNISELLQEIMEGKGVSVEKLSQLTNIPHRFVVALKDGDLKNLPAKPYVRGYLLKIAEILDIHPDIILKAYKQTTEIRTSGEEDRLPINRFAIEKMNKKVVLWILIILIVIGFVGYRFKDIVGTPSIEISLPETSTTYEEMVKITGRINPRDRLTLNDEIVYTDESGSFEKEVRLSPGLNALEFDIKRFLGQEIKLTRQVFYEPQENNQ